MKAEYVATIGYFDGVHLGHQMLLNRVREEADRRGLLSMAVTFDRQPRQLFDPAYHPQLLSTLEERVRLLEAQGMDVVEVLPFTDELASLSAQAFMQQVLHDRFDVRVLVTGYDHRFGHHRSEGFDDYVRYGRMMGMEVLRGDVERMPGETRAVSSSVIRDLLSEGKVEGMPDCLSRYYSLTGKVVAGEHIGHELGFPTANLMVGHPEKLIPASGVYAVWVLMGGRRLPGMMNIGTRPTFDGSHQTLEVHILGDVGDVYGRMLEVEFVARLRSERRFDSREALIGQLQQDRQQAMVALEVASLKILEKSV